MHTHHLRRSRLLAASAALLLATATGSQAAIVVFNINANGIKEVSAGGTPSQGDLDGTAIGTLALDNITGSATFNITLTNIDVTTLSGHHIHQAPSTTTGSIVLDFGDPDTIRTGSVLSGTITGLSTTTINNVFANPTGFYYNLHNGAFPGGAVRDQIPEASTALLGAIGALGLLRRRRR